MSDGKASNLERRINLFTWFAWICLGGGVIAIIFTLYRLVDWDNLEKLEKFNEIGDFWAGSVTAVWSLGSIFFIYVAFLGQRLQIALQSKELEDNRAEFRAQTVQLQAQTDSFVHQQFENTFFNLVNGHHRIVETMKFGDDNGTICFKSWYKNLQDSFNLEADSSENKEELAIEKLNGVYNNIDHLTSHCFSNMINIIEFVGSKYERDTVSYKFYIEILQAQLSIHEILMLAYYLKYIHVNQDDFNKVLLSGLFIKIDKSKLLLTEHCKLFTS